MVRQIVPNQQPLKAYFADTADNHRAACHAVSWLLKAPESFHQLMIE